MKIKNIIFDFGGVIIDLDYSKTYERLKQLTNINYVNDPAPTRLEECLLQYEIGRVTSNQMINFLQQYQSKDAESSDFIDAWNAMLIGIPEERIRFLEQLRNNYRIFLLSNTNELHLEWVNDHLVSKGGIQYFESLFDKVYYSHLIHMRKPDPATFSFVLESEALNPEETIFIDDTVEHVEGANSAGIHSILHNPESEIMSMLSQYITHLENAE